MRALSIAATGMNAQQLNLEVIANNIANINTTGYKRARAEFSDLLYQTERAQGVPNRANQAIVPEGAKIGLGVQTSAVRNLHLQGSLVSTGNELDLALIGRGWFQIETPDGETAYTRAGAFNKNADGQLVTIDGYTVVPEITVPQNASEMTISASGQVMVRIGNDTDAAGNRPADDRQFRQRGGPRAAGRQSLQADAGIRRAGRSARRPIRATRRSSRNISKRRTSIRSRKSPT